MNLKYPLEAISELWRQNQKKIECWFKLAISTKY